MGLINVAVFVFLILSLVLSIIFSEELFAFAVFLIWALGIFVGLLDPSFCLERQRRENVMCGVVCLCVMWGICCCLVWATALRRAMRV
jgi:hypothetical protein